MAVLYLCMTFSSTSGELDPLVFAGESIGSVAKLWDNINDDRDSAKIQLKLTNYSKHLLNIIFTIRIHGNVEEVPNFVGGGHMEAILAYGKGLYSPTKGLIGWSYRSQRFCLVYWRVQHDRNYCRDPNRLAMNCYATQTQAKTVAKAIQEHHEEGNKNTAVSSKMKCTYSQDDIRTLKYCDDNFCLQGTIPTNHRPTLYVSVLPLNATDWASKVSPEDIENLDFIEYNTTNSTVCRENPKAVYEPFLYTLGAALLVITPAAITVYCRRRKETRQRNNTVVANNGPPSSVDILETRLAASDEASPSVPTLASHFT